MGNIHESLGSRGFRSLEKKLDLILDNRVFSGQFYGFVLFKFIKGNC